MSSATPGGGLGEHTGLCDRRACDIAQRVDIWEPGAEVALVDGHPPINREPGILNHFRHAVDGDPNEQVVWHASAACESSLSTTRVEARSRAAWVRTRFLALPEHPRMLCETSFAHRNRCRHWPDDPDPHVPPDSSLNEAIVQQQCTLERSGWTLEGLTQDRDDDRPRIEVGEHFARSLGARDRVILEPTLLETWSSREVVVRPQGDGQDISVVRALVRRHSPVLRVDRRHTFLAELDPLFGDIAVMQPYVPAVACRPNIMSSFENPKLNESFWSSSVTRTSSASESESPPPAPGPRSRPQGSTTCFFTWRTRELVKAR